MVNGELGRGLQASEIQVESRRFSLLSGFRISNNPVCEQLQRGS